MVNRAIEFRYVNTTIVQIAKLVIPNFLVNDAIASRKLVLLFPKLPTSQVITNRYLRSSHAGRSHAAKAQLFIAHLKSEFGKPAYWDKAIDDSL